VAVKKNKKMVVKSLLVALAILIIKVELEQMLTLESLMDQPQLIVMLLVFMLQINIWQLLYKTFLIIQIQIP